METPRNKAQGLYLKKSNNRWKWMAVATAASAAGVTASQADTITINPGGFISADGGNHLNADLTGDGHPDLTIARAFYNFYTSGGYMNGTAGVTLNGVLAFAGYNHQARDGFIELGSQSAYFSPNAREYLSGSIPIFFKDLHINGGVPTKGSLEVTVFTFPVPEVQLDSFTYTSNTPVQGLSLDQGSSRSVPDQGSSLALLAMGAGGILALRRCRAAQGCS